MWLAEGESGDPHDDGGCPYLITELDTLVLGPEYAVRIRAHDEGGPTRAVFRAPEGCPVLSLEDRLAARRAMGDPEAAARLHVAERPDDPVAQLRVLEFDLDCESRIPALVPFVRADPALARDAAAAAVACPDKQVLRWVDAAVKADPDDPVAWSLKADVAKQRGDARGERTALEEVVRTSSGDRRRDAENRLRRLGP